MQGLPCFSSITAMACAVLKGGTHWLPLSVQLTSAFLSLTGEAEAIHARPAGLVGEGAVRVAQSE